MLKVILTKGLPASGKTTWAKKFILENEGWKRVNKDDIREMIDAGKWSHKKEKTVVDMRNELICLFLQKGFNVIVDDTNLNPVHEKDIKVLIALGIETGDIPETEVEIVEFDTPIDECIARDLKRHESVGEKVIRGMYDKYIAKVEKYEESLDLPLTYIFDVDGTLATKGDRDIFDYSKVIHDNEVLRVSAFTRLLHSLSYKILIMSGRDDDSMSMTEDWLKLKDIPYDGIFMRKAGDRRSDEIVKRELFEANVRCKYYVCGVFDDRNRVVKMWRNMGLTCFQVAEGDF